MADSILMRCLTRLAGTPAGDLSDAELLERYRRGGEEAAFTLLVQRHGPAVLGVCRRTLGNTPDADDAFQTTFVALLTRADSIRRGAALGCWLYGVALRLAAKARARRIPGRQLGSDLSTPDGDPVGEASRRELLAVLDEEIGGLPEKYRVALVLCGLGGRTCEQAARELGWPKSTVIHRLARARQQLRQRLMGRGFEVPAALLVAVLAREATASHVPAHLTLATVRQARRVAAGAAPAARLAGQGAGGSAVARRLVVLGLAGALGLAVGIGASGGREKPQAPPAAGAAGPAKPAEPASHVDREGFPLPAEALARVGSVRLRQGRSFLHLEYSPDGSLLASSGYGQLRLWEARTGKLVREITVPGGRELADSYFTADGKAVVLVDDGTARWFDVGTGKEVRHCDARWPKEGSAAVLAPGGEALAVVDLRPGKDLVVVDLSSGAERFRKTADRAWCRQVQFSPDGKTLAAVQWEGKAPWRPYRLFLLDARTGRELASFDPGQGALDLAFSPDSKTLLGTNRRNLVQLFSVPGGETLRRSTVPANLVNVAAFTPDGKSIVVGSQDVDTLQIDAATGKEVRRFRTYSATHIAFTADGKTLAVGRSDGSISQWDLATGQRLPASSEIVNWPLRFSADAKLLWVGRWAEREELAAVDWQTGRETSRSRPPRDGWTSSLALSADCSRVAAYGTAGKLTVWDASSGKELRAFADTDSRWNMQTFSPDAKTLYAASPGKSVRAWDVATGKELAEFKTGHAQTTALVTSPDGRWLAAAEDPRASATSRPQVSVWDLAAGREARSFRPDPEAGAFRSLAFSPDGNLLAAAGEKARRGEFGTGSLAVWDVRTGEEKLSLTGLARGLNNVCFSPDGRLLVTGGFNDGAVRLWEVATGHERHHFSGTQDGVFQVLFSPDGKLLASNSTDTGALIWDVEGRYAKRPSATPLTAEEGAALWTGLDDADAAAAFAAIRRLLARPGPAVELLRQRLRPAPAVEEKAVRGLLRDLDADDFAARKKAAAELEAVADRAAPVLRKVLAENPSAETKRQIEHVLELALPSAPQRRRELRAVEVLERLGTPEACELLAALAGGEKESFLTSEARAAVGRLKGR
jgi:RNA polymerase sigma factor (sigma-70 family)